MLGVRCEVQNLGLRGISEPRALAAIQIPIENPKTRLAPAAQFTGMQPLTKLNEHIGYSVHSSNKWKMLLHGFSLLLLSERAHDRALV